APGADVADERVEIRVQHRLAAAERDDRCAKRRQLIDARLHDVCRHRSRHLVVLVAVAAVDVAAANGDDLDEQRVRRMHEPAGELPERASFTAGVTEGHDQKSIAPALRRAWPAPAASGQATKRPTAPL